MKRQSNMAHVKEQIKTPEKQLKEMETNNLSDAEFKTLVVRMFKELSENFNNLNKNNLQGNKSRVVKLRITSMIWNIRYKKQLIRTRRIKKNPEKMRIV